MGENKVLIPLEVYNELASMYERVEIVAGLYNNAPSLDMDTVLRILGIRVKEKEDL